MALRKQDKAQMTSDLSADQSLNNEHSTQHQRCRIDFSDNEVCTNKKGAIKHTGVVTVPKVSPLPHIPLPVGLGSSGVHSVYYLLGLFGTKTCTCTRLCTWCLCSGS